MNIIIVKIGGSVITKKSGSYIDTKAIERIGKNLIGAKERLILIHGTGHIGKPPAIKYGYVKTKYLPPAKNLLALKIKNEIDKLTTSVKNSLCNLGVPVLDIDNNYFINYKSGDWESKPLLRTIKILVANKVVPLFSGNFIPTKNGGFEVLSSDEIVLLLARLIKPKRIVFLTDVDGILDKMGNKLQFFNSTQLKQLQKSNEDVSGGMKEKAKIGIITKNYCKECIIANGRGDISFIQNPKIKLITGTRII